MKKTLFIFFFLTTGLLIAVLFFNVSNLKRYDVCIIFTESGGDTIKNLPLVKTAVEEALTKCTGTPVLVESGSIFQAKENIVFYKDQKEGVSPAVKFLETNSYDFASISPMAFQIPPDRLKHELQDAEINVLTANTHISNMNGVIDINGVELFFISYVSDKGSRYLDKKTKEKWGIKPPFVIEDRSLSKTVKSFDSDIKIALLSEDDDVPFGQDDFSETMIYFHNVMPSLNIFITDSKDFSEKMNLRESLVVKTTSKTPSVVVAQYSIILNEEKQSAATIKKSVETFSLSHLKGDRETEKMIEPYIARYDDYMNKENGPFPYSMDCENPGKEECFFDRLFSIALEEAASECSSGIDFTISFPVSGEVSVERGSFISRKYIGSLFPLNERGVVLDVTWDEIVEIMNNNELRSPSRFLSLSKLRYRYSPEGEFLPSRVYRSDRNFKVVMSLSLFKKFDLIQEYEKDICISSISPSEIFFRDIATVKMRNFWPAWRVEDLD